MGRDRSRRRGGKGDDINTDEVLRALVDFRSELAETGRGFSGLSDGLKRLTAMGGVAASALGNVAQVAEAQRSAGNLASNLALPAADAAWRASGFAESGSDLGMVTKARQFLGNVSAADRTRGRLTDAAEHFAREGVDLGSAPDGALGDLADIYAQQELAVERARELAEDVAVETLKAWDQQLWNRGNAGK